MAGKLRLLPCHLGHVTTALKSPNQFKRERMSTWDPRISPLPIREANCWPYVPRKIVILSKRRHACLLGGPLALPYFSSEDKGQGGL